jgi:site-specific DNA-methyltransferase (adenine-specific)
VSANLVVRDDAVNLARWSAPGGADLVYLDPPFAVGIRFRARPAASSSTPRGPRARATGPSVYDDRWPSLEAYLAWLKERLAVARDALAPHGTLWLHLDQRAVHEAKAVTDSLFGRGGFVGEIIWLPGNGTKARRGPGVSHQTILVYARSRDFLWNGDDPALRAPYAATSQAMHFTRSDEEGRAYRERVIGSRTYRYYADQGRALGSVWSDCPSMVANTPLRKETTGYPTQKPRKLLDRIVRAASAPGGLVIDPFHGSGTTLVAAAALGRRFVGIDVGEEAHRTALARLASEKIAFSARAGSS